MINPAYCSIAILLVTSLGFGQGATSDESNLKLDCEPQTSQLSLEIGDSRFWIPGNFVTSDVDRDTYHLVPEGEIAPEVQRFAPLISIHSGEDDQDRFKNWAAADFRIPAHPELELLEQEDDAGLGLVIYSRVIRFNDHFIHILSADPVSWPAIVNCISS